MDIKNHIVLLVAITAVVLVCSLAIRLFWKIFGPNSEKGVGTACLQTILTCLWGVSPVDLIPDVIPIAGWADDSAIIVLLLFQVLTYLKNGVSVEQAGES